MGFKIQGFSGVDSEVETNTRALRMVQRPDDYGSLGIYSISQTSGTMTAALIANQNIWTFRNSTANVYLVRQVRIGAGYTNTAPGAAGVAQFSLFVVRGNTANATGGTAATITGNFQKRRTSPMATSGVADVRIASTGAITLGTGTVDAQAIGALCYPYVITTAGQIIMPPSYVWDIRDTEYPLVLAQSEGIVLQTGNAMPATATWQFNVSIDWLELASY